jgi:glycosyltransferase involved in cell wall biosynthesis
VPRILAAADVLVHPARYDAYGLAVHEALCAGVPVIVSARAGVSERLAADCPDWVLAAPDDVPALVDRLRVWRRDRDAWSARAEALGARLRAWTWDDMAREIRRLTLARTESGEFPATS